MASSPLPIIEGADMAQVHELVATGDHTLRNLSFDQACILFGIAFPGQVVIAAIDVQITVQSAVVRNDDNLLLLEWNEFVPEISIFMYVDIRTCQTDAEVEKKAVAVPLETGDAILKCLYHWGLVPVVLTYQPEAV